VAWNYKHNKKRFSHNILSRFINILCYIDIFTVSSLRSRQVTIENRMISPLCGPIQNEDLNWLYSPMFISSVSSL